MNVVRKDFAFALPKRDAPTITTKRKANPNPKPSGYDGNDNAAKDPGTHFVKKLVFLRPDQAARLSLEINRNKFIRDALDAYIAAQPVREVEFADILDALLDR